MFKEIVMKIKIMVSFKGGKLQEKFQINVLYENIWILLVLSQIYAKINIVFI